MRIILKEERKLWRKGYCYVVSLDEAGRGPLAGPVVAAAVVISRKSHNVSMTSMSGIKDSKKLTPKKRKEFYEILINHPQIKWGIGRVSERVIDKINILEATKLAMKRAIKKLKVDFMIIDGNFKINSDIPQKSIIKGDEKVFSCMAASIIAKIKRDDIMRRYHKKYSQYGFNQHKGYPTKFHKKMLRKYGFCKIHRKSFKPIKILRGLAP